MTSRTLTVTIRIPLPDSATLRGTVSQLPAMLATWRQRAVTRRQLADLDAHQRRDLGLTWEAIRRESGKPFWRP